MIFDGNHLCDYLIVNDIRRYLLPPKEAALKRIPGRIGARFIKSKTTEGIIEVDITIIGHNAMQLRDNTRAIASFLNSDGPKALTFTDEPDKYYMAILDADTPLDEIMGISETTLYFTCPDPLAYGNRISISDIDGKTILNKGTAPAKGVITVNMTATSSFLEITLLNTGEFLYIEDDFNVGDIVVVDLNAEHITKNDYSAMPNLYLESDFFELPVGEFEISVSSGKADIEFRERWL